jgi:AcrR family transcriptional regulator
MSEKTVDRRVQRTRKLLQAALAELILEKRFDKITIQDIIDRANVGRSTFYAHFRDKEDLLVSSFTALAHDLSDHVASAEHDEEESGHLLHSLAFFRHAYQHHELYRAVIEGGGEEILLETGRRHLLSNIQDHLDEMLPEEIPLTIPLPVITNYLSGAMQSLLTWWLNNDRPYPPKQINEMFQKLAMLGVKEVIQSNN